MQPVNHLQRPVGCGRGIYSASSSTSSSRCKLGDVTTSGAGSHSHATSTTDASLNVSIAQALDRERAFIRRCSTKDGCGQRNIGSMCSSFGYQDSAGVHDGSITAMTTTATCGGRGRPISSIHHHHPHHHPPLSNSSSLYIHHIGAHTTTTTLSSCDPQSDSHLVAATIQRTSMRLHLLHNSSSGSQRQQQHTIPQYHNQCHHDDDTASGLHLRVGGLPRIDPTSSEQLSNHHHRHHPTTIHTTTSMTPPPTQRDGVSSQRSADHHVTRRRQSDASVALRNDWEFLLPGGEHHEGHNHGNNDGVGIQQQHQPFIPTINNTYSTDDTSTTVAVNINNNPHIRSTRTRAAVDNDMATKVRRISNSITWEGGGDEEGRSEWDRHGRDVERGASSLSHKEFLHRIRRKASDTYYY